MIRRSLLVLAASREQMDVILRARSLGYRVLTLDNVPSNPGHALADASFEIDTTDREGVLEIARRERVDGVLAVATDVAVPTVAHVARELGLVGPSPECVTAVCGKLAFRRFLASQGLPAPRAVPVSDVERPDPSLFQDGAWVMKPERSSGSKGVFVVTSASEFERDLPETLGFDPERRGILEQFLPGEQGTCEGVLRDGRIARLYVFDRQTVPLPHTATAGHRLPSRLSPAHRVLLETRVATVWERLGLRSGPFDCDFVVSGGEVYLLEMSPRVGGNSISRLLEAAAGFDILEFAVRHACGEAPELAGDGRVRPTALILLGLSRSGRVTWNEREEAALRREAFVQELSFSIRRGDEAPAFTNGRCRVGQAIIVGNSRDGVDRQAAELLERLDLKAE